ncbi:MAG: hypothetical protein QHH01_06635, partial [Spirochaetales bacterium]|nr:hypothetical protein [Spirochaetales bacterium]
MSTGMFSPIYIERVLKPAYRNWIRYFWPHLMRIQKAHLCMLAERGVISQDVGRTLHDRLEWMTRNWQPPVQYPVHEAAEDLYFVLEQELARLEGEE